MALLQFQYEAKNRREEIVSGSVEAISEESALETLQERGLTVLSLVGEERGLLKMDVGGWFNRPNNKDVVVFTRQLATVIAADVPLIEGLNTIARQSEKPVFTKIVMDLAEAIRGGNSLSGAVAKYPKLFTNFYVSLVRSGEVSGRMEETLLYLADYLERNQNMNSKVKGALAYPGFILFALVTVMIIMVTSVLPKMLGFITEAGVADIPLITRILIALTDFVNRYLWVILAVMVFGIWFVRQYARTLDGKKRLDYIKISFPRLGVVARNVYIARIAETLSTLIKSGVPILEGLKITSEIANHSLYREILIEAQQNVQNGGTISEVLFKYPKEIPRLVASMLTIGEKTGKTDFMLENIFKFYNAEAERDIQNLSQLIEPILILLLGLGVALLVSAIMLPMFSLVNI
ncbi:MAG: hypothetical protein A3I32_01710 [Candidatus Yanofskybacteria bacterium RIFCSPLOWO2_02_FULL_45_10]|uniref:Type II secretion system protein GspF domain-containing protein n=2 Tax=Candidatus Yanofskyibacteriota TaxID=1752733 RepID=A0A1F8G249_9BACT|nr:MAG: hypothetical protein A3F25_01400 [Candidatus Yanofskybacteria bacterium RIFCSPHIGHO2_12_FULL_45_19b]OGN32093.1 MAG: hypothetical protein A3I32_01710 [Candidatus Yanofskybacteria bacterium RIFCSPLOWO2_02_FULL_45_10]